MLDQVIGSGILGIHNGTTYVCTNARDVAIIDELESWTPSVEGKRETGELDRRGRRPFLSYMCTKEQRRGKG